MADIFEGIDMTDPCQVWPVLQGAYNRLLSGDKEAEIEFRTEVAGGRQKFYATDLTALKNQIDILRGQCEEIQTGRPTRFAIRAGMVA